MTPSRGARDPRIDLIRGLALVMIFINHIPGNVLERFTSRNWGFSDAAEAFVLLSGTSAALAYGRWFGPSVAEPSAFARGFWKCWARAWQLYLVHILISVLVIGLAAAMVRFGGSNAMIQRDNFAELINDPFGVLIGLPLMLHQFGYINILSLYVLLLLATPGFLWIGRRWPLVLLALSVGLWLIAGLTRTNVPNYPNAGGWFLNPLSWQLLFVVGLLIGLALREGRRLLPRSNLLTVLAAAYVLIALLWVQVPAVREAGNTVMVWFSQTGAPRLFTNFNKSYLELPRLLHVLAMAWCLSVLPGLMRLAAGRWAEPLNVMGRQGLAVFSVGTVLCFVIRAGFDLVPDLGDAGRATVILAGLVFLVVFATHKERVRDLGAPSRRVRQD